MDESRHPSGERSDLSKADPETGLEAGHDEDLEAGREVGYEAGSETGRRVRHFTVAVFVVRGHETLLLHHRKHEMWLPPGGHIEPDETPDEAALREVFEETGLRVFLVGQHGLTVDRPVQLVTPEGVQLETIGRPEDRHEHIDLVYFSVPTDASVVLRIDSGEVAAARWCDADDLGTMDLAVDVREWAMRALQTVPCRLRDLVIP